MLLRLALASGLFAATTFAFQDTSPFFAFSTSDNLNILSRQVATTDQLLEVVRTNEIVADVYIVVSQPGVSADDFQNADAAPHMRRRLIAQDDAIRSKTRIPEIIGGVKARDLEANLLVVPTTRNIMERVDAIVGSDGISVKSTEHPYILRIDLPTLPTSGELRTERLAEHDSYINTAFDSLADAGASVSLFYTSTPPSAAVYASQRSHSEPMLEKSTFDWETEDASPHALHIDLKRDISSHITKRANVTLNDDAPLFEKYNFFGPGIFMGILVILILLSIASVGVKALGGLQVSYAAFSKENGPQAQKKGQQ